MIPQGVFRVKKLKQYERLHISDYLFTLFFIGLLLSSYLAFGEEYVVLCGGLSFLLMIKKRKTKVVTEKIWVLFIIYYLIVTIFGAIIGLVDGKGILEFLVQYPILILIILGIIRKSRSVENSMRVFKTFILVSTVYGLFEAITKHNVLPDFFSTQVMGRIEYMNLLTYKYQSSSFYLHYTYFGVVILVSIAINMIYPYRNRSVNSVFYGLSILNLYFSKSRMCLLLAVVLLVYDLYKRDRISIKMLKRGLLALVGVLIITIIFWNPLMSAINNIYEKFAIVKQYGFEYGSFGQRIGTLLRVPSYMGEHPIRGFFGTGFLSIKRAFLDNYSYFQDYGIADNQMTTFLIEVGIFGTIIAIIGIVRFFKNNRIKRSLSKYLMIIVLFSSITLDVIGTIYITALVFLPFILFYEYERKKNNVQPFR